MDKGAKVKINFNDRRAAFQIATDKDTSGLLVVAKTPAAREGLKALFQGHDIERVYDAIVVGSGYGGGIAASRLARMGLSVAVLERGREVLPGLVEPARVRSRKQRRPRRTAGS